MTTRKQKRKHRENSRYPKPMPPETVIEGGMEVPFEDSLEFWLCAGEYWHPDLDDEDEDLPDGQPF